MKRKIFLGIAAIILLCSHDLYLKIDNYLLKPNSKATLQLFNGSFNESENIIDRNRMIDASFVGNGERIKIDSSLWFDKNNKTLLTFNTGKPGTWLAGVSTSTRKIEMSAAKFNKYLENDGVIDMLKIRKEQNEINLDAVEKYSKHVKTIFQVGDKTTDDWKTVLNYPIEFVSLENPYKSHAGHEFSVKLLFQGKPLANHLVGIGVKNQNEAHSHNVNDDNSHSHSNSAVKDTEHGHSHSDDKTETHSHSDKTDKNHSHTDSKLPKEVKGHTHEELNQFRTNAEGIVTFKLTSAGIWFLKTIHMKKSDEEGFTHESNWATLTFQVGNSDHSHDGEVKNEHSHDDNELEDHHHHEENDYFSYIFWIGSILVVGILFFIFNKKK